MLVAVSPFFIVGLVGAEDAPAEEIGRLNASIRLGIDVLDRDAHVWRESTLQIVEKSLVERVSGFMREGSIQIEEHLLTDILERQLAHELLREVPVQTVSLSETLEGSDNLLLIDGEGVQLTVDSFHKAQEVLLDRESRADAFQFLDMAAFCMTAIQLTHQCLTNSPEQLSVALSSSNGEDGDREVARWLRVHEVKSEIAAFIEVEEEHCR